MLCRGGGVFGVAWGKWFEWISSQNVNEMMTNKCYLDGDGN